jgi:hypothetical protein
MRHSRHSLFVSSTASVGDTARPSSALQYASAISPDQFRDPRDGGGRRAHQGTSRVRCCQGRTGDAEALGLAPAGRTQTPLDTPAGQPEQSRTPPADAIAAARGHSHRQGTTPDTLPVRHERTRPATVVRPSGVSDWLMQPGGRAETSMRRLADVLGRCPSGVHDELRRLAAAGVLTAVAGPRGDCLDASGSGEAEFGRVGPLTEFASVQRQAYAIGLGTS